MCAGLGMAQVCLACKAASCKLEKKMFVESGDVVTSVLDLTCVAN